MNSFQKFFVKIIAPELLEAPVLPEPEPFSPRSLQELIDTLKRTPTDILSTRERHLIANLMSFTGRRVDSIMIPKHEVPFVRADDFLGPLMLDRLYRSGLDRFPVLNHRDRIVGILPTSALNSLEIKKTDRAKKYLITEVFYLKSNYTLEQAMAAFVRTNNHFFIVINSYQEPVGILTFESFVHFLFGRKPIDDFDQDQNPEAVAKRQ